MAPSLTPAQPVTPFHYAGIIAELSEGLKHVLQAQDWKERPDASASPHDALMAERGNLIVALSHVRNAFAAIDGRHADLHGILRMAEAATMERVAPAIARAILADPPLSPPAVPDADG